MLNAQGSPVLLYDENKVCREYVDLLQALNEVLKQLEVKRKEAAKYYHAYETEVSIKLVKIFISQIAHICPAVSLQGEQSNFDSAISKQSTYI